jgi:primosomal protein N'
MEVAGFAKLELRKSLTWKPEDIIKDGDHKKNQPPSLAVAEQSSLLSVPDRVMSKREAQQQRVSVKKFKAAHQRKSTQLMKDLKMQQALFHGLSKQRIVNVNEKGKKDPSKKANHMYNDVPTQGSEEMAFVVETEPKEFNNFLGFTDTNKILS